MRKFVYLSFLLGCLPVFGQQYDPLEGVFTATSSSKDGEESPKRKQKNLAEWMELNLAYAPAGGLVQHTGGYTYTWLDGAPVVWKGPNEGKRIIKNNVPKDIEPLLPYPAQKCVCIFNHEVSNKEYWDFVTDVVIQRLKVVSPNLQVLDKEGLFSDSFNHALLRVFLPPNAKVYGEIKKADRLGTILIQSMIVDTVTKENKLLHQLLTLSTLTFNGVAIFPDISGWQFNLSAMNYHDPMREYYTFHRAYGDYPVCNLLQSQAMAYCAWLSKQLSAISNKEVVVALPTEQEWIQAASYENAQRPSYYKPSVNKYWRNEKGIYIANFVPLGDYIIRAKSKKKYINPYEQDSMVIDDDNRASNLNDMMADMGLYQVPVFSYWMNDAGCYNIFGNLAEMTSTNVGDMMVVKGGCFIDVNDLLFPGSKALVYTHESLPMVGFRPVVKLR